MAEPPSVRGAAQATVVAASSTVAVTEPGAPATARGVPDTGPDASPAPSALTARSSTEYAVPLVSPEIVRGLESAPPSTQAPPSRRTSMRVMAEPPSSPGVKDNDSDRSPAVSATSEGASGVPWGATSVDVDAAPAPKAFTARIWTV